MRSLRTLLVASLILSMGSAVAPRLSKAQAAGVPLASQSIKLTIAQDGIYRLTYSYLQSQGIDLTGVNPATLGLSDSGSPVPIYVSSVGTTFVPGDFIEFYGHPANNTYAATNNYVLSDTVTSPARAASTLVSPSTAPARTAQTTDWDQQRTLYWSAMPGTPPDTTDVSWPSDGDPHWAEGGVDVSSSAPTSSTPVYFNLQGLATSGSTSCAVDLTAVGTAYQTTSSTPAHQLTVAITDGNGVSHTLSGSPFTWTSPSASASAVDSVHASFPCSWLVDTGLNPGSTNQITFGSTLQAGSTLDEVLVTTLHISYTQNLCAQSDQLSWQGPSSGGQTADVSVSGFSAGQVSVWRLDSSGMTRLSGVTGIPNTGGDACHQAGTYAAAFADTPAAGAVYYATASPLVPQAVAPLDTTDITSGGASSAQYLIITNPLFTSGLSPLVSLHQSQGMTVKVVNVNTIYDQYGDGQVNPDAIRSYITYAHANLGTQYVLLVGGDTYDSHNFYGCPAQPICASSNPSNQSFIPSLYVNGTFNGATPADNLFAVPTGAATSAPDVAIGRLPVNSTAQLQAVVARTVQWNTMSISSSGTASFGAGWEDPSFQTSSDAMAGLLPGGFQVSKFYENGNTSHDQANRSALIAKFSAGQTIVNFVGHGNLTQWSKLPMLRASDVPTLTNGGKPSMVFQWGCQTSNYAIPTVTNIDSALLTATDGSGNPTGAVLTVGSTGLDLAVPQETLAGGTSERGPGGTAYFFGYLAQGDSVGTALELAKDDLLANHPGDQDYLDVVNSYSILGDPALAAYRTATLSVPLHPGWNLIGMPARPASPPFHASDLAAGINASLGAGAVQLVAGYGAGAYYVYTPGVSSSDFTMSPGQGVFVQLKQGGSWADTGYTYQQSLTYGLSAGWNLVALPYPALTAGGVQRSIDAAAKTSTTQVIAVYANGRYQTYVPGYSQDFALSAQQGVYVLSRSAIQWTP